MRPIVCVLLLVACQSVSKPNGIENPTGMCTPPDDGSRAGYHSPEGSQWLRDCKNPLKREYFRVFAQSSRSAYMIPRPDGNAYLQPVCEDAAHELRPLVDNYGLCAGATSAKQAAQVNDMLPADALALAHFLHGELKFTIGSGDSGISPSVIPTDVVATCGLHQSTNSAEFETLCDRERGRLRSGNDIGFSYEGAGAVELVERLNELYGIDR
jgi:hypothetical protein